MSTATLRQIRDRWFPFARKHIALRVLNPVLKWFSPLGTARRRLEPLLKRHGIQHMDLGGWTPVEGYLTIHLSPVEPYGLPRVPRTTLRQVFDPVEERLKLVPRDLDGPAVLLHFNVLGGIPLSDESFAGVNLSHILEHFDLETGRQILAECRRILRPGGAIRVSCPDLRKYAQAYVAGDEAFFGKVGKPLFCPYSGLPTPGAIVAGKAYDSTNCHKWFYDAETVQALMREAGFSRADQRALHETALPSIQEVEPGYREAESFYVEGIR